MRRASAAFPIPTADTTPGTIVRSEVFPDARGLFVGVSPAGVLWVAWRRCETAAALTGSKAETVPEWHAKFRRMAERLHAIQARHVARQRLN
jgi:hypothetical protein